MIQILLQMMPMILELLKKNKAERAEAAKMGEIMQRAAMKADDAWGIFAGGVVQRLGQMTDEQQTIIEGAMQGAMAVHAEQQAAKGGGA